MSQLSIESLNCELTKISSNKLAFQITERSGTSTEPATGWPSLIVLARSEDDFNATKIRLLFQI